VRIVDQAERGLRARTGDAVDQQALAALECDEGGFRAGTELAVDAAGANPSSASRLQGTRRRR
jgi:hypothetical protein